MNSNLDICTNKLFENTESRKFIEKKLVLSLATKESLKALQAR